MSRLLGLALLLLAGTAAAQPGALPGALPGPGQRWAAVLVAGDGSLQVFDNAAAQMAALLRAGGAAPDIRRLSADPAAPYALATRRHVLDAIAALRPAPGAACLVFVTSHGAHGEGVYLAPHEEFLTPGDLDAALRAGCGAVPTVAIVSACYSGGFARPPMARPNRILLTAARADRPSFGCSAGRQLTFYDQCLLGSLRAGAPTWPEVIAGTGRCVARLEAQLDAAASEPQGFAGAAAAGLPVVGR